MKSCSTNIAFVTSHPIQYQVPVFRELAQSPNLDFEVLFATIPNAATQGDGFGVAFEWDIPLLEGYQYSVLENVSRHPSVTRFNGCDTPSIGRVLKSKSIDVVVVNGWVVKSCLQTLMACKRLRIPCIVRGEANDIRTRVWWKRRLQQVLVNRYDAVLAIGKANREFYRARGVPDSRIFSAPYCVENARFASAAMQFANDRTAFRKQWAVPEGTTCLLYCGKFEAKKHPIELLDALADAVTGGAKLHLLMVGDGELRGDCQERSKARNLPVTYTGFLNQSEIVKAYVASDLLVLPSDAGETWGLVVNECMACGIPAIVSDQVGCAADLIESGTTGWTFPFGDWQQLTQLLVNLTKISPINAMGSACLRRIKEYSPAAAAEGTRQAIHYVMKSQ